MRVGMSLPMTEECLQHLQLNEHHEAVDSHSPVLRHSAKLNDLSSDGGVAMTPEKRLALMEKLRACYDKSAPTSSSSDSTSSSSSSLSQTPSQDFPPFAPHAGLPGVIANLVPFKPSRSIFLRNLFSPPLLDPLLASEIEEDVREECASFGPVVDVFLDPLSDGHLFVKFETVIAAQNAIQRLNGRLFDGLVVSAMFYPEPLFPRSHKRSQPQKQTQHVVNVEKEE